MTAASYIKMAADKQEWDQGLQMTDAQILPFYKYPAQIFHLYVHVHKKANVKREYE